MSHAQRLENYQAVSSSLSTLRDEQVSALLEKSAPVASGIRGTAVLFEIAGVPVFAKRVALTELERCAENRLSTTNVFKLPAYCHYGVGSPGFGVWRELAANTAATAWVLNAGCENFPLVYHWRELPNAPHAHVHVHEELADVERAVAFWNGSSAMRARMDAIAQASASVVMFFEYIPQSLQTWLIEQKAAGGTAIEAACAMVERGLLSAVARMNAGGLMHFDAHFRNILTDGERLYFADLGLATMRAFDLSNDEIAFVKRHANHDACYAKTQLVNWLVSNVCDEPHLTNHRTPEARNDFIQRCAEGAKIIGAPAWAASTIERHSPIASVMNAGYWQLHTESRTTPFPADEIERVRSSGHVNRHSLY
jgi:hypothetical protein